jgi:hypothetical protein
MLLLIAQGMVLFSVFWVVWQTLSRLLIKNDLDNVPGPSSNSRLKGECFLVLYQLCCMDDSWWCKGHCIKYSTSMVGVSMRKLEDSVRRPFLSPCVLASSCLYQSAGSSESMLLLVYEHVHCMGLDIVAEYLHRTGSSLCLTRLPCTIS